MPIETITKNKRKRLRWTFERVINGERIRRAKLLPQGLSQQEADSLARKWEAEIYAVANGERKPTVTVGQCVAKHIDDKGHEWKDRKKRLLVLRKWSDHFADQDATDLHDWSVTFVGYMRAHVDERDIPKMPLAPATIRNILSYIRSAIKYSYKVGLIGIDETSRMAMPSVNNARHHYPARLEMLLIARKCRDREARAALRVGFYSGMRQSEILRATPTKKGWDLGTSKNGRPRIIPIHPKVAVIARNYRFSISVNALKYQWIRARRIAGFPKTRFHDLRHGSASEMINAGVTLYEVGAVLGHKSMVSTARYSHLVTDRLEDAVGKIGRKK